MDAIKQVLRSKPNVSAVYFNEAGEYLFFPRPGFEKKMTRDEILKSKSDLVEDNGNNDGVAGAVTEKVLAKAEDVESFEKEKAEFAEAKAELQLEQDILKEEKDALAEERAAIDSLKGEYDDRGVQVTNLQAELKAKEATLKELNAKVKNLEKIAPKEPKSDTSKTGANDSELG